MKFDIILTHPTNRHLVLNTPEPATCSDVLLLVAEQYGEAWYGACVSCESTKSFICNAVKEYYDEDFPGKSVYEHAIKMYRSSLRERIGLVKISYDYFDDSERHDTAYDPFEEVK